MRRGSSPTPKYKLESDSGGYPNADHYQMLAYCTALQVPVAWLVYASGSRRAVTRHVRHSPVCQADVRQQQ